MRIPTLGGRSDDPVDPSEDERREFVEAHCLDGRTIGVAEHEEPVGERTQERARAL